MVQRFYGFNLEEDPMEDLAINIPQVWAQFLSGVGKSLGYEILDK